MNKLILAISILATAAAIVPANAAPRNTNTAANLKMFATSPGATIRIGDRCWKQTDAGRGYGFWTGCDTNYTYAVALVENQPSTAKTGRGRGNEGGSGTEINGGGGEGGDSGGGTGGDSGGGTGGDSGGGGGGGNGR